MKELTFEGANGKTFELPVDRILGIGRGETFGTTSIISITGTHFYLSCSIDELIDDLCDHGFHLEYNYNRIDEMDPIYYAERHND